MVKKSRDSTYPVGSVEAHSFLIKEILLSINSYGVFWSHPTGVARALQTQNVVHYGLTGSPDIVGFTNDGFFVGIEVKTGKAIQTKEQINFQNRIQKTLHGIYILARSVKDVISVLEKKRAK